MIDMAKYKTTGKIILFFLAILAIYSLRLKFSNIEGLPPSSGRNYCAPSWSGGGGGPISGTSGQWVYPPGCTPPHPPGEQTPAWAITTIIVIASIAGVVILAGVGYIYYVYFTSQIP